MVIRKVGLMIGRIIGMMEVALHGLT